jgi:hypothetical protein
VGIDEAKIVWAREIRGVDLNPRFDYSRGRYAWLLEPDASFLSITPYSVTLASQKIIDLATVMFRFGSFVSGRALQPYLEFPTACDSVPLIRTIWCERVFRQSMISHV